MKNTKSQKKSIKPIIDSSAESLELKDQKDIIIWSFNTKRSKSEIFNDFIQLNKKINKNKPKDLNLIKKMINLHNEYRFPLIQLMDTNQKSIDIAYQFFNFLIKIKKYL
jgi:hypothetical protein